MAFDRLECIMSSTNLLLLALTSVFIACNQLGVDPAVLPYMVAIAILSIILALVAIRKPTASPEPREPSQPGIVRQISNPRERRC